MIRIVEDLVSCTLKNKIYDLNLKEVLEPGEFDIMVGPSSQQYNTV